MRCLKCIAIVFQQSLWKCKRRESRKAGWWCRRREWMKGQEIVKERERERERRESYGRRWRSCRIQTHFDHLISSHSSRLAGATEIVRLSLWITKSWGKKSIDDDPFYPRTWIINLRSLKSTFSKEILDFITEAYTLIYVLQLFLCCSIFFKVNFGTLVSQFFSSYLYTYIYEIACLAKHC